MNKHFIKATTEYCTYEAPVAAPYLRRTFELDHLPDSAKLSICGLGFYCLFINGKEITKGHLAPYVSNPDHLCYYDTYDVAPLLKKGKNAIGIILGNGFINSLGGYVWNFDKAPFRDAPKVALELSIAAAGHDTIYIEADESFKTLPSPIILDDVRYGEYYDAREQTDDWCSPELDDEGWNSAIIAEAPKGELKLCEAEPIRIIESLKPVKIIKCKSGYVYDFGKNSAGVCQLRIKGSVSGQRLSFRYFERMKDGEPDVTSAVFPPERFADYYELNQKDIYTCRGNEEESWQPRFTYHGFRYVLVEGLTEAQATKELLTYHVMHSDLARHGDFKCSDERVNKIFDITVSSDLSNFYYYPTDCPHREKNGWTGDIAASCFHMMMLYDCKNSFSEWLAGVRKSQTDDGVIPGIVPTAGWGYDWGNGPAWDRVAFYLPYECWRLRGDTKIIKDNADMMARYLEYVMTRRNEDGTISFGLGDWASVGRRFSRFETPLAVSDSIIVMDMAKKATEMFAAIGQTDRAARAEEICRQMRSTIRNVLLDKNTCTLKGRTQTAQAMGLYHGIFEPEEEQTAFDVLVDIIHEKNDSFDCGLLGSLKIFHVLSRFGRGDLAFYMITKKEFPSYGLLVDMGETTLVERFMPDNSPEDSHNHHFLGDVSRWFVREIGGLRVKDHKTVEISPDLTLPISSAEAYYELPAGKVAVKWERKPTGAVCVEYTCPESVSCTLKLPENAKVILVK